MFDLQNELKMLPERPGVYIMHSSDDTVIYVGKAKILKNRVRQYFGSGKNHTPKVKAMVANVAYFEYIITDTELEALALECNLIKKYRPRYNILLKDDKHYPYIKVTMNEDYPKITTTRKCRDDGAKYFGPYTGSNTVRNTLEVVRKIFSPPVCGRKFPDDIGKGRPCLNYHIKNCFAPCTGKVSLEEYRQVFSDICSFLSGNHGSILKDLNERMKKYARELEYERAADIRDKIAAIEKLDESQKVINASKHTNSDIIAISCDMSLAFVEVFFVREGKVIGRENYRMENADTTDTSCEAVTTDFIKLFYSAAAYVPEEIISEFAVDDEELICGFLSEKAGKSVKLTVPKRGDKKKLVALVKENALLAAQNYKTEKLKAEEKKSILPKLKSLLGLERDPVRIESYDISNISGSDNVAAMVVFTNGIADRKNYRKFKIKSLTDTGADRQANDYAAMREVIYRRMREALDEENRINAGELERENAKFLPLPDCIFLDGGAGHVSVIKELFEEIDCDIPLFGMVKDDRHRTRAMVDSSGREIEISMISNIFAFVTRIQDEVHRCAIGYHRQLREKNAVRSELDDIKGIGEKRRKMLFERFKTIENMRNAPEEELAAATDKRTAKILYDCFHGEQGN
ncbi:MAG: excinuclease ABC subunit UvrC [Oscillospiraceae bacterium]|nr:excinuclease ABC subunit UvrC [Oscillospiraceae bacterium]